MEVRRAAWLSLLGGMACCLIAVVWAGRAAAADEEPAPKKAGEGEQVVVEQSALSDKYKNLEKSIERLAADIELKDKRRADLLRQAFKQSKEKNITGHFDELVEQLQQDQLPKAMKGQAAVQKDLLSLLELLLSEDRSKQIESEKARIKAYIQRIDHLIKEESAIQGQTPNSDDLKGLAGKQNGTADKAGALARDMKHDEGSTKPGANPANPNGDPNNQEGNNQGTKEGDSKGDQKGNSQGNQKEDSKGDQKGNKEGNSEGSKEGNNQGNKEGNSKGDQKGDSKGNQKGDSKGDQKGNKEGDSKGNKEGNSQGNKEGNSKGDQKGDSKGNQKGDSKGDQKGNKEGDSKGNKEGNSEGNKEGNSKGNQKGDSKGDQKGDSKGDSKGNNEGNKEGNTEGNKNGNSDGNHEGDNKGNQKGNQKGDSNGDSHGDSRGDSEGDTQGDSNGKSDTSSARKRIQAAEQRMREAKLKLEDALRRDAVDKQEEAMNELKNAKAELEEILRQLREEEIQRTLAMLEARFHKMLEMQVEVYEGTKRVDQIGDDDRDQDAELESRKLSRKESNITTEADKCLEILREEGTSVAMPEAVLQMRDDMEQVTVRLARTSVGKITQGVEEDIITALEEMIAALKKAQKDQKSRNQPPMPSEGEPQDPALVDQLAELKMIRALQMRVNTRTQRYSKLIEGEQADKPELLEALNRLSEREERIHKSTRDIVLGRNK
ncbi:MAG TPA: hypothetical protein VFE24_17555 [Pirellulales bacterium]|jgi:hypothetical protein|nr:hypothetical protein [Pirellulales bacterium]